DRPAFVNGPSYTVPWRHFRLIHGLSRQDRNFKLRRGCLYSGPAIQGYLDDSCTSNSRFGGPHGAMIIGVSALVFKNVLFSDCSSFLGLEFHVQDRLGRLGDGEFGIGADRVLESDG